MSDTSAQPNNGRAVSATLIALDKSESGRQAAITSLQELYPTAQVVGAGSVRELEAQWSGPLPRLAIVAFELDGQNGLDAAQRIVKLSPSTQVLVYADAMPESVRRQLLELGCGFMGSPVTAERVLNALDCCAAERALACRSATVQAFA